MSLGVAFATFRAASMRAPLSLALGGNAPKCHRPDRITGSRPRHAVCCRRGARPRAHARKEGGQAFGEPAVDRSDPAYDESIVRRIKPTAVAARPATRLRRVCRNSLLHQARPATIRPGEAEQWGLARPSWCTRDLPGTWRGSTRRVPLRTPAWSGGFGASRTELHRMWPAAARRPWPGVHKRRCRGGRVQPQIDWHLRIAHQCQHKIQG